MRRLLVLTLVASCGGDGEKEEVCDPDVRVGGPATGTLGGIDFRSVGGFTGQGDGSSLRMGADGAGVRVTRAGGMQSFQLAPAALADIAAKVEAAKFSTLCKQYLVAGESLFLRLTVDLDNMRLEVEVSPEDAPPRLTPLIDTLVSLTNNGP